MSPLAPRSHFCSYHCAVPSYASAATLHAGHALNCAVTEAGLGVEHERCFGGIADGDVWGICNQSSVCCPGIRLV